MDSSSLRFPRRSQREENPITPLERPPENSPYETIVVLDGYSTHEFSPQGSPKEQRKPVTQPENTSGNVPVKPSSPVIVANGPNREELSGVTKEDPRVDGLAGGSVEDGDHRRSKVVLSILRRSRKKAMVRRAALGFRVCEIVFCLVSTSVMAANKTQGWSGDSFDRYKEYRYCISVTTMAFFYSGFQAYNLAYHLITGKHIIRHRLRPYFDFSMDQILSYLLISASSSAATRVDDWQSNWGKDKFTEMASASISMSFLAFAALAVSSIISCYNLCTRNFA